MKIFGIEKLSMVDYDGHLCTTVFTGGCNFRCPFCHNKDLVQIENVKIVSEEEFFKHLERRKGIIDAVCISGGEPTLQSDLEEFVRKIKARNLLVKLDTNGTNPEVVKKLIDNSLIDYVAMDVKNSLPSYAKTAGSSVDAQKIKRSVSDLMEGKIDYEFRTTLVKNHHTELSIEEMGRWLAGAKKLFLQKFVDSGNCIASSLEELSKEKSLQFKEILQKYIDHVELRGY